VLNRVKKPKKRGGGGMPRGEREVQPLKRPGREAVFRPDLGCSGEKGKRTGEEGKRQYRKWQGIWFAQF